MTIRTLPAGYWSILDRAIGPPSHAKREPPNPELSAIFDFSNSPVSRSEEIDFRLGPYSRHAAANAEMRSLTEGASETTLRHAQDHYRAMSVLQKAIRLQDEVMGARACCAMINGGHSSALWRRLRVIAVEDVGLGDPEIASWVLWVAKHRKTLTEQGVDAKPLAIAAMRTLCAAPKSRDMCDVASWIGLPGVIDAKMRDVMRMPACSVLAVATAPGASFRTRVAAVRRFYPARFKELNPWPKFRREDRLALYRELSLPTSVACMIEWDVEFGGDVLTATGPAVWALMSASRGLTVATDPLDPGGQFPQVGRVYGSAFDRHTHLGKRAIGILLNQSAALSGFFKKHTQANPMDCLLRAVFYVEGSILRPKLSYEGSAALYWAILEDKFRSTGIPALEPVGLELLGLTQAELPRLNEIRAWLDRPAQVSAEYLGADPL
jgi:hypothetical protein